MDVNSAILRIPSPATASSSEGVTPRPHEAKPANAGGTKKSFASVLHTVHQSERKERPKQSEDADCSHVAKSRTETEPVKGAGDVSPRSGKIETCGRDAEPDRLSESQTDQSDDKEGRSQDESGLETSPPAELVSLVDQVFPSQGTPVTPPVVSTDNPGQGAIADALTPPSQKNETGEMSAAPVLVTPEPGKPDTVTTVGTAPAPGTAQGAMVPLVQQSQPVSAAQPFSETNDSASGQFVDPAAEPVDKAVDQKTGDQRGTPTQGDHSLKQAVSVPRTTEAEEDASPVSKELSRLDAAGPQPTRLAESPVQQKQADAAGHPHPATHSPRSSPDTGSDERGVRSTAIAPHGLQAGSESGQSSDLLWSNQGERQSSYHENPWMSHAATAPSQSDLSGDHSAQPATAGSAVSSPPRPMDSRPASPAGSASPVSPAHDIEPFMPPMSRSVVFEIAEPDLGRINIRVAMTNELVHTHLSSDRSDVGQFLFNGQDRLQSALQSNGLEMGQFRVDIDRQSAGRSFQQGPPQDQSRMWQQASNGSSQEAGGFERHEAVGLSYAGRLNVVA